MQERQSISAYLLHDESLGGIIHRLHSLPTCIMHSGLPRLRTLVHQQRVVNSKVVKLVVKSHSM